MDNKCDGMRICLKGSIDCFDKSIFTISTYSKDLKDIFSAIVNLDEDKFPILRSIDWYGHTFINSGTINLLINDLEMLKHSDKGLTSQIERLIGYINNSYDNCDSKNHVSFLFDGM